MIERLQKISRFLDKGRHLSFLLGALFAALFVYSLLFDDSSGPDLLTVSILGLLWSIMIYAASGLFLHVPGTSDTAAGSFRRMGRKIHRAIYYLLGALFLGLTFVVLYLSVKLIAIWLNENPVI